MIPKRCLKCGKMLKMNSETCKCGAVITEQSCLLHFQSRPRMFSFIRRFAGEKGITIEEAMMGFMAVGVKVFPMYTGANVPGLIPWISQVRIQEGMNHE